MRTRRQLTRRLCFFAIRTHRNDGSYFWSPEAYGWDKILKRFPYTQKGYSDLVKEAVRTDAIITIECPGMMPIVIATCSDISEYSNCDAYSAYSDDQLPNWQDPYSE